MPFQKFAFIVHNAIVVLSCTYLHWDWSAYAWRKDVQSLRGKTLFSIIAISTSRTLVGCTITATVPIIMIESANNSILVCRCFLYFMQCHQHLVNISYSYNNLFDSSSTITLCFGLLSLWRILSVLWSSAYTSTIWAVGSSVSIQ